ncbi:MAG: sporulation protein, partial [bacterium]
LSSSKISGLCGRLICCLGYEYEFYAKMRKNLPHVDSKVQTPDGPGKVISVDVLKKEVSVQLEEGAVKKFPADELNRPAPNKNQPPKSQ